MLGSAVKSHTTGAWVMLVSYPLVQPGLTVYTVILVNDDTGWKWEGHVTASGTVNETRPLKQITEAESRQIAESFVKNSPTFKFDGMEDTFQFTGTTTLRTPFAWQFTFAFQSRHGGYGDRTGQFLDLVITPHNAVITVIRGQVVTATLDDKWNMLEQKMNNVEVTEAGSRQIAENFVINSPTFKFDGIKYTLKLLETLYPDMENTWQFVFYFESANAGYGDRTGQMVAEVITPHETIITVAWGEVTAAVMDGKWDMIKQQMIDPVEISLAPIHAVDIFFMESFPVQIGVRITGGLRDGCTTFHDAVVIRTGNTINITVTVQKPQGVFCPAVYTFFEKNLNLGSDYKTGTSYTVKVNDYTSSFVYQ